MFDLTENNIKFSFCSYCDIKQILYCLSTGNTTYCRKPLNYKGKWGNISKKSLEAKTTTYSIAKEELVANLPYGIKQ